jgi:flagellar protein FliJ
MAFKYRLDKVLDLREQELETVKAKFQKASAEVRKIEQKIADNKANQIKTQKDLVSKEGLRSPQLYLNRLKHLKDLEEKLVEELYKAKEKLAQVRQELLEAQQKAEALKKHKEKKRKEYEFAELKKEENELNEIALLMKYQKDQKDE